MYYGGFVNNEARKEMGIKPLHYMVGGLISSLSKGDRWCDMSRQRMGDEIGVSKPTIINIVKILEAKFLVRKSDSGKLKTTPKWSGIVARHEAARKAFFDNKIGKETLPSSGKESLPENKESVKKLYHIGKESLPPIGKETLPNTNSSYTVNYTLSNGERKTFSVEDYCRFFGMPFPSLAIKENFGRLPEIHKIQIANHLPQYIQLTPERRYRKSPLNYILDETYLQPVIDRRPKPAPSQLANPKVLPTSTVYNRA